MRKICKIEEAQNMAESGKTEQQVVIDSEQVEVSQLYRAYCQKDPDQKDDLVILYEFSRQADRKFL